MATEIYNGEINMNTDWGNADGQGTPLNGAQVQQFIKDELGNRFGYLNMRFNESESMYYIECFTSEDDYKKYEADKEAYGNLLLQSVQIPISTVEGDTFTATLKTSLKNDANIVVADGNLEVPLNYRSIKISQIGNENAYYNGTLNVYISTDGQTWNLVGSLPNVLTPQPIDDTETMESINIGKFLKQGRQQVRLNATYEVTAEDGSKKIVTSGNVLVGSSVTKTNLEITLATNYYTPMYPTDTNGNPANFSVSYQTAGSVNKVLHLEITGSSGTNTVTRNLTSSDSQYVVSLSDASYLTHGVKKVKAWMTCEDGLGNTLTSNVLVNRFMMVADANDAKPYLLLQNIEAGEEIDNFVQTDIAEYAVYSNNDDNVNITFLLTSYAQGTDAWTTEYFRMDAVVKPKTANKLLTTVEIEAVNDAEALDIYTTYFRVLRGSEDFMYASTGERFYKVDVDNTKGMTPIPGATFRLNPKVRNNNEANPLLILNAKDNNKVVDSEWTNADLINGMWVTDDQGNKVLRIMAGTKLEIKRDIWAAFRKDGSSSMTFEIDCKISNVTNTTDPIIQAFSGTASSFRGLKMNALEGWLMNGSEQSKDDCLFAWQEDVRTHFSINLNSQVYPNKGDVQYSGTANPKGSIALARVLINGDCVRELKYDTSKTDEWTTSDSGSIIIGNDGADIDIHSISIYEDKDNRLDMVDIMRRNRLAALPTSEKKEAYRKRNDLLNDKGLIDVEKVKLAGKNSLVWHGVLPYKLNNANQTGWFEVFRYDENGSYMPEYSGTLCKETGSLSIKGQGTTAKTYYDWNIQDDMSKVKATIQVAVKDFHESIHVRIEGDKAYIYGGNLGKNIPIETAANEEEYPYANGYVTVPDGWIDGNGKYRGKGYMVAPNTSLAQKKVLKINYASSMQSHLWGACNTYDELHRIIVGNTPIQELIPTAVSAKRTEPFMFFSTDGGDTYFRGMGNYGAGKADKVTWGYVKKLMPLYALIEGSDNNPAMTNFLVPFDKNTAQPHYDEDGKFDGWMYDNAISWDYDLGATGDDGLPTQEIFDKWADIHNFIYLHSTNLKFFDGTFEQFKQSDAAKDTNYKYWCTTGVGQFELKRYDFVKKEWVAGGLDRYSRGEYMGFLLSTREETSAVYHSWVREGSGDYNKLNEQFKEAFVSHMKKYLKYFINEKSLQFNYCYVLQFLAGTDNSAKNTYYKINPIGIKVESDSAFASWYNLMYDKDFDFSSVHQLYFDGDDMDSIFRTDNNAHQTKPYYIERMYPYADDNPSKCLYEGMKNQLFNFVEKAYASDGTLADMMRQILNAAQKLVKQTDVMDSSVKTKVSAWGFLHKYFFNAQTYFPEIAYLEQARIRYEFPELVGYISSGAGTRSIRPITQSLGSQLQNELQYMNQRLVYFASYASFGEFGSASGYTLGLEDAKETFGYEAALMPDGVTPSVHTYTIKSHQYIYPCYFDGSTFHNTGYRLSPNDPKGCTFTITENGGGDTGIGICGINYISDLGDLGNKSITSDLIVNGKRLVKLSVTGWVLNCFNPNSLLLKTSSIRSVFYNGAMDYTVKNFDLSGLIRCRSITLYYGIKNCIFPKSSNLDSIDTTRLEYMRLENIPNLKTLIHEVPSRLKSLFIGANVGNKEVGISVQSIVEGVWNGHKSEANPSFQSIHVENVNWKDFDVEALSWFADRPTCEFKGTIAIKEDDPHGLPRVTWDLKNKFNAKFGNVDNVNSSIYKGLKLTYKKKNFDSTNASIKGNFYVEAGNKFKFELRPSSIYENTYSSIDYFVSVSGRTKCSMDASTGVLTVSSLSNSYATATVRAEIYTFQTTGYAVFSFSKTIEIWNRPAQVGDLVYADGTFSSAASWDEEKTPIGICFYVPPRDNNGNVLPKFANPNDKQLRLMVALEETKVDINGTLTSILQWGCMPLTDPNSDVQIALYDTNSAGNKVNLTSASNKVPNVYDISAVRNLTSRGLDNVYIDPDPSTNPNGESDYRDLNTDDGLLNDGFKCVTPDMAYGDGFAYNESNMLFDSIGERTLNADLAKLAGSGYKENDIVNSGYAKTLKIIAHRNNLLNNNIIGADGEVIYQGGSFPLPSASGSTTEIKALGTLIDQLRNWASQSGGLNDPYPSKWQQLAYPFVSACYAYQPTQSLLDGEVLADKFKSHNWFAPTEGHIARICWYAKYGTNGGFDPFKNAREKGLLGNLNAAHYTHWSVTESHEGYAWYLTFINGLSSYTYKFSSNVARAIASF